MFEHIPPYPGDPILSLVEDFLNDPRPEKINLSIGLYYNDKGEVPLLSCVYEAEKKLIEAKQPRSYLPMEGYAPFREAARAYVFGANHPAVVNKKIATVQSIGGSGALSLTANFMRQYFPDSQIWISDPTWTNHRAIFEAAGATVHNYPYYDVEKNTIRFPELLACVQSAPEKSMFIMHPCCHNPTGMDLTQEQWAQLIPIFKARNLIAYLDIAYQGFAKGIEEDAWAVREFAASGVPTFVGSSFSKNFSVYAERVGAVHVVCADEKQALCMLGQLKAMVRQNYSSPPSHGAMVISAVLRDEQLRSRWEKDVTEMRNRIKEMRQALKTVLSEKLPSKNFNYITEQQGMFSYTGLNKEQVERLKKEFAIYLVKSGRLCIAGLNRQNIVYVAESMAQVIVNK